MKEPNGEGDDAARGWFWRGCAFEAALGGTAYLGARLLHWPLLETFRWSARATLWGGLAILPLLGLYAWVAASRWAPWVRIREFLNEVARPVLMRWSVAQLLAISIVAGISEEMLFRGLLQGALERKLGWWPGWCVASLLFGAGHAITPAYAVVAAAIGLYLGAIWAGAGNLLTPIVAHAGYDFIALLLLTRNSTR